MKPVLPVTNTLRGWANANFSGDNLATSAGCVKQTGLYCGAELTPPYLLSVIDINVDSSQNPPKDRSVNTFDVRTMKWADVRFI